MQNASNQSLSFYFPPTIFESKSGKCQDYVSPLGQDVALRPDQTKTIPMNGTCLERDKPPEGKGVTGDLILNDGNPEIASCDSHFAPQTANTLLRIAESTLDAVDQLQKEGAFKDFPYHDKQEQKNIAIQWSVWSNPRICEITGSQPATKEDFQTVVYKQVKEGDLASPKTKEKIDKGDDAMWTGIELASAKAKDLEKPDEDAVPPPSVVNVTDNTSTAAPLWAPKFPGTTQEKPKADWPPPVQKWVDKKRIADSANKNKETAHKDYAAVRQKFFQKSRHYNQLRDRRSAAAEDYAENDTKEDKAKFDAADKELKKLEGELEKDFLQTPEGQAEFKKMTDVDKAADQANADEKEAGKNLDKATKDSVQKAEAEKHPPEKKAADAEDD
jgi:hypothetical protein